MSQKNEAKEKETVQWWKQSKDEDSQPDRAQRGELHRPSSSKGLGTSTEVIFAEEGSAQLSREAWNVKRLLLKKPIQNRSRNKSEIHRNDIHKREGDASQLPSGKEHNSIWNPSIYESQAERGWVGSPANLGRAFRGSIASSYEADKNYFQIPLFPRTVLLIYCCYDLSLDPWWVENSLQM